MRMQAREKKRGYTQLIWTVLSIINLKQKKALHVYAGL